MVGQCLLTAYALPTRVDSSPLSAVQDRHLLSGHLHRPDGILGNHLHRPHIRPHIVPGGGIVSGGGLLPGSGLLSGGGLLSGQGILPSHIG